MTELDDKLEQLAKNVSLEFFPPQVSNVPGCEDIDSNEIPGGLCEAACLKVAAEVRRLTVEACARLRCRRCAAGEIANWTEMGWRHGNILMCQANDIRALLPQVRAEEKP